MRRPISRARPAWAIALVCSLSLGACKKQEPAPVAESSPRDAGQATAAAEPAPAGNAAGAAVLADTPTPFLFKDVKLTKAGTEAMIKYTLANQGARRARGFSCLAVHDKDGYLLTDVTLGPISLRGGESDGFEDKWPTLEKTWVDASTVRLYAASNCLGPTASSVISHVSHLDLTGRPAPKDAPAARPTATLEDGVAIFDIKDARLSQEDPSGSVAITFSVTNNHSARASASLCVRLYDGADSAGDLDEASSTYFSLSPGASTTVTSDLSLDDEVHWDAATHLKAYVSNYGCASSARAALSNVVEFSKPATIHAPREAEGDEPTLNAEHSDDDHEDGVEMDSPENETDGQ
ncbi:hypothetical protein [Pyxidicoccus trucidator]|uniref:hypothetical protein n=1 Tax=Pyxidicoccus trucidator TaxID=2709662 RepID=UPI0013DAAD48|nr:hypothetical protein [Pyxidicoccus trucidator]